MIAFGGGISLAGNFLSSFATTIGPFLACYTLMNGIGCGMCYMVALICGWEHLPSKRGLVTGLCLGGYGFGTFIFAQVSTALVNPEKLEPVNDPSQNLNFFPQEVSERVPLMIRNLTFIWCFFVASAICLISRPAPRNIVEEIFDDDFSDAEKCNMSTSSNTSIE